MRKVNLKDIAKDSYTSPLGKFSSGSQEISKALGRNPLSLDVRERHPFDVEICTVPPGKTNFPYHSHSAQWEYYHILSGRGTVRHQNGLSAVQAGDAFIFEPGQPHQIINDATEELVMYVIADNPLGESCHYPDSQKWMVRFPPEWKMLKGPSFDYFEGEE